MSSRFPTTRWTLIRDLDDSGERTRAVEYLLQTYWEPLYHYARRRGLAEPAAEDAIQHFVVHLLEREFVSRLDRERGHLRGFLKTAFRNFLATQFEHDQAQKRGGAHQHVALDPNVAAEQTLASSPRDPEHAYDLAWALVVMNQAYARLADELRDAGDRGRLELFERYFGGESLPPYSQLAPAYGLTPAALKAFLHRTRARFRDHLHAVVEETCVEDPEGELDRLQEILRV